MKYSDSDSDSVNDSINNPSALKKEMAELYPTKEGFKVRLADSAKTPSSALKWKISLLSGIIFLIVSAPLMYRLLDSLGRKVNIPICDEHGCPTPVGMAVTAVIFVLITRILMK
jgi:hypothetical protein